MKKYILFSIVFLSVLLFGFFLVNNVFENNSAESKRYVENNKNEVVEDEQENDAEEELDEDRLVGIPPEELTEEQKRELNLELLRIEIGKIEFNSEEAKRQRMNEIFAMLGTTEEKYQAKIERQQEELTFGTNNDLGPDKYANLPPK